MRKIEILVLGGALLALMMAGCAASAQQRAKQLEPIMSAAGFHMHPADTEEQKTTVNSLPPYKMHYYMHNGKPHYWYADPGLCGCIFIGNEKAYQRYQELKLKEQIATQQEEAAELYQNAATMNWSLWPYDPMFY